MKKTIDIKAALQFGYDTLRDNFVFFLKVLVIGVLMSVIPTIIVTKLIALIGPVGIVLQFLNLIWHSILAMGILKICLKLYDKKPAAIADLWSCLPLTLDYLIAKIIFSVIVTVGLILLLIPGLIWSVQFYLASYLVVDRQASGIAAIKSSSVITHGAKWDLGIFASVMLLINFLGAMFVGVGLLLTLPITMLAGVYIYRDLLKQTESGGQTLTLR